MRPALVAGRGRWRLVHQQGLLCRGRTASGEGDLQPVALPDCLISCQAMHQEPRVLAMALAGLSVKTCA